MNQSPYSDFRSDDLTLRDHLAVDRTVLANERTYLAYIRTALAFVVIGATFLHFLHEVLLQTVGYAFAGLGGVVFVLGTLRFFRMRKKLTGVSTVSRSKDHESDLQPPPHGEQTSE